MNPSLQFLKILFTVKFTLHSDHHGLFTKGKTKTTAYKVNVNRFACFLNFFFKEYSPILKIVIGKLEWKILSCNYQKCLFFKESY